MAQSFQRAREVLHMLGTRPGPEKAQCLGRKRAQRGATGSACAYTVQMVPLLAQLVSVLKQGPCQSWHCDLETDTPTAASFLLWGIRK